MLSETQPTRTDPDSFLPTRRSLISRLRDWEDRDSWQEFFDTYWRLIYSVALKAGLTPQEAEEAVQETIVSVAKQMDTFRYDAEKGSFKGWLRQVTRRRIVDQFRKRKPDFYRGEGRARQEDADSRETPTIERLANPQGEVLERVWDDEWEENLIDVTMERVKVLVRADHFQIFYMSVIQGRTCREVARLLRTTVPQVYLVRHRIGKLVKQERLALEREQDAALARRQSASHADD